jgi:hypothetical protein
MQQLDLAEPLNQKCFRVHYEILSNLHAVVDKYQAALRCANNVAVFVALRQGVMLVMSPLLCPTTISFPSLRMEI